MATDPQIPQPAMRDPAGRAAAITPSDSADLTFYTRGIYVGVGGDVAIVVAGNTSPITFKNAAAGSILPVVASRVYSTSTTATNLVALW